MENANVKALVLIPVVFLAACLEQRAVERFDATVNRLCVAVSPERSVDKQLSTHTQGCVLVSLNQELAAGLDEIGLKAGVYSTQATNLGFTQYLDEVVVARAADMLVFMTPIVFHELAQAAGAVLEARAEEQQLREGLGLVIAGSLRAFAPTPPKPLTQEELTFLRKAL
jgi:hypothetical protein